jgi:DnaJ-class molecular chaperone with C-terminal Zn finger domain
MIRMPEMGEAIKGGATGDLYIKIYVAQDKLWKREGNDLIYNHNIKLTDAILGAIHIIHGLDGDIKIDIPAGVQPNEIIRVKGRGVPYIHERGKRGDVLIKLNITLPKKLSSRAKKIIEELREEGI